MYSAKEETITHHELIHLINAANLNFDTNNY